jgi:hypothetical protein
MPSIMNAPPESPRPTDKQTGMKLGRSSLTFFLVAAGTFALILLSSPG